MKNISSSLDFINRRDAGRVRDRMAVLCPAYDWSVASFEQQTPKAVKIKHRLVATRLEVSPWIAHLSTLEVDPNVSYCPEKMDL